MSNSFAASSIASGGRSRGVSETGPLGTVASDMDIPLVAGGKPFGADCGPMIRSAYSQIASSAYHFSKVLAEHDLD